MTIQEILTPHQAITHAILFGSRARGTFKPTSDVDIALKGDIDIRLIAKIKAEFEDSNLPFFVDIVDYAKADNALKSEIDTQGIMFYAKETPHSLNMANGDVCHSEALAEESQENTIILTQNQIAFSKYPAFTYILTNKNNTTLYIGVTGNLQKRIYEHKNHLAKGFSNKYNCEKLVYFESFDNINQAIEREKYLKGKKRAFKENLINAINPKWLDLYDYLFGDISGFALNRTNSGVCHSATSPCHSEPALAGEESNPSCHTKPLGEVSYKSNRDISHFSNAQYDKMTSTRHSEALAEESQKSDCHSKTPSCHSERSEESNRDISLVSQAQYDNRGRK